VSRANDAVHPYEVVKHYYGGGMEESTVPGITLREHFALHMYCSLIQGMDRKSARAAAIEDADLLLAELAKAWP
jgi:hypothetical protein